MCDGYNASGEDDHPDLEDEFLCEYVDGTMDPVVQDVFEEYLCANPELRDHVECLRNTRLLLCRYGCRCHAPHDLHDRLRRQITCDLMNGKVPFHVLVANRLKGTATVTTAMALLMVLGMIGGFSITEVQDGSRSMASAAVLGSYQPVVYSETKKPAIVIEDARITPRYSSFGPVSVVRSFISSGIGRQVVERTDSASAVGIASSRALP